MFTTQVLYYLCTTKLLFLMPQVRRLPGKGSHSSAANDYKSLDGCWSAATSTNVNELELGHQAHIVAVDSHVNTEQKFVEENIDRNLTKLGLSVHESFSSQPCEVNGKNTVLKLGISLNLLYEMDMFFVQLMCSVFLY